MTKENKTKKNGESKADKKPLGCAVWFRVSSSRLVFARRYIGTSVAKPQYGADKLFPILTLQNALFADSFSASHPLHVPYEETLSGIEIDGLFDTITYDKGASVIRMLRSYMSQGKSIESDHLLSVDPFVTGLRSYLSEYKYENAKSAEFWSAMAKNSPPVDGVDLIESMRQWISRPNYPLVSLRWKQQGDYSALTLAQTPFLKTGTQTQSCSATDPDSKWWIPFTYITSGGDGSGVKSGILDDCEGAEISVDTSEDGFAMLNPGQSGFYRVNYPQEIWGRLAKRVRSGSLSSVDASMLLDDAYALVEADELVVDTLLDLALAGSQRTVAATGLSSANLTSDYQAWYDVAYVFNAIVSKLEGSGDSGCHDEMKKFVGERVGAVVEDYGVVASLGRSSGREIEGSFQHRLLVGLLFSLGVQYGNAGVGNLAQQSFANGVAVHPNLRYSVFKATAKSGSAGYDQVLAKYKAAIDADEKEKLMQALGAVDSEALIARALALVMTPDIESMDVRAFVGRVAGASEKGRAMAWAFLQDNFEALYAKVNGGTDVQVSDERVNGAVRE